MSSNWLRIICVRTIRNKKSFIQEKGLFVKKDTIFSNTKKMIKTGFTTNLHVIKYAKKIALRYFSGLRRGRPQKLPNLGLCNIQSLFLSIIWALLKWCHHFFTDVYFFTNIVSEKKKSFTFSADTLSLVIVYQLSATRGSKPFIRAKFSKNFLLFVASYHQALQK